MIAFLTAALAATTARADNDSLTWHGITLYGTYDIALVHLKHGAPLSSDWNQGIAPVISANSNRSITTLTAGGMSQSKVGLRGTEVINEDLDFIFLTDTGFNPYSGRLTDGPKSLVANNGVPLNQQKSAGDSGRAGQLFNGALYAGLSSKTLGTLTAGRNNTLFLDYLGKYDALAGGYEYSMFGYFGSFSGGGNTQDNRLDNSLRYTYKIGALQLATLYQFGTTQSSPGKAWEFGASYDYGGLSASLGYQHKNQAISENSLSVAQAAVEPVGSLAAKISDNNAFLLGLAYRSGIFNVAGGYEHIKLENPSRPLMPGFQDLSGNMVSVVNNSGFPHPRQIDAYWLTAAWQLTPKLNVGSGIYHYTQNAYGAVKCSDRSAGNCSGDFWEYSVRLDYFLSKHFDVYGGIMFSKVSDGLASGFLYRSNFVPSLGMRFQF